MREAHPTERAVGVAYYASDGPGTGGRLRDRPEDFRVRELERAGFEVHSVDADRGDYPHLVVRATLRSWDTNDFARAVSRRLGISRERVSWAGTKDKHAVTTQLFTVRAPDVDAGDLPDLGGADVEVLGRAGRSVRLGDLAGNAFRVVVRDATRPERAPDVTADLRAFGGDGGNVAVPNFFGQQRFGSTRPVTHEVGLAVVRGDWEEAVLTYVGNPHDAEPAATREARTYAEETRDWAGAAERFPEHLRYERTMCYALAESGGADPEDFRAALETLPSNLQRLLVNAAQSFAFNRTLSRRMERGLPFDRPVEGDVVCFADDAGEVVVPDPDRVQRVTDRRVETVARHCERGRAFVTAPLVGTETELGEEVPGEIERSVLEDLDLAPEDFDLPGKFGSTGTRRAVLVRTDVSVDRDPLSFEFSLPKGSYATTLLREYLKVDPARL